MNSLNQKLELLKVEFLPYQDQAIIYEKIIFKGKQLDPFPENLKTEENRVFGCQSTMYINATYLQEEQVLVFNAYSDALISAGLASLLLFVYNHESPKTLFVSPPVFLQELGILSSLSFNRAQGVLSLYQKMQKIAVPFIQ